MTYENQAGEEITDRTLYQKVVNPVWDVISRDDIRVVLEAEDVARLKEHHPERPDALRYVGVRKSKIKW